MTSSTFELSFPSSHVESSNSNIDVRLAFSQSHKVTFNDDVVVAAAKIKRKVKCIFRCALVLFLFDNGNTV